jgi:mannosyltransferase
LGALCLFIAIAAVLRLHNLAARNFWLDEGISVGIARLRWADFARVLWEREANMSLYYLLLRGWLTFGGGEFFVRALSALSGVAAVPLIYALGRQLFGAYVGLAAAGLLAINVYHLRYSQEARAYPLAVLLALASAWLFARFVETRGARRGIAWAAVSALLVYSHFYGALVVAAELLSLAIARPSEMHCNAILRPARWLAFFTLPVFAFLAVRGASQMDWIPRVSFGSLWPDFVLFAGNAGWPLAVILIAAMLAALWSWRESWRADRRSFENWSHAAVWSWAAFPVLAVLAGSAWRPLFLTRYLIVCLPALILLLAVGIFRIRPVAVRVLAFAAIALLSARGILSYYKSDFGAYHEDWRGATRALLASARPDDGLIFYPGPSRMDYEFYRSLDRPPASPRVIYPAHGNPPTELSFRDFLVQPLAEVIENLPSDAPRVWIVLDSPQGWYENDRSYPFLRAWCLWHYHQVSAQKFEGVELVLFSK